MIRASVASTRWHRKAKWMLKKILLKPPTDQAEMRQLCHNIVERRFGNEAPTTTAIVSTALSLFEDQNLVQALNSNPVYKSARERIFKTANHILPAKSVSVTTRPSVNQMVDQFHDAFLCPVCGNKLHCLHDSSSTTPSHCKSSLFEGLSTQSEKTTGCVGHVPKFKDAPEAEPPPLVDIPEEESQNWGQEHSAVWFGPLVLTTLAVVGIAVSIFSGELGMSRGFHSATSRAVVAISVVMRTSEGLIRFLNG
eukprot:TRINITY_DN1785_c0_g1_i1.p1 TRINITY_DN1785_c0_g1~~TRINITY_DN1785_c0_g1_i1.p1  ORF type:complete len:252 (-),score=17.29 TRINITY_DN1785_c0_g1_i1:159-914(-)